MGCPTSYDGMSATWSKGKLSRLSSTIANPITPIYNAYSNCLPNQLWLGRLLSVCSFFPG